MWFRDFLGKFFTTKTDVVVGETLKATIFFKELAIQNCIRAIANTLVMAEFETFENGVEIKGPNHYLFNVEPNPNQNAVEFWSEVITRLVYDDECLVMQQGDYLYPAKSFSKIDSAFYEDTFTNVVVKDLGLKRGFKSSEVLYFKLHDTKVKKIINGLFIDYAQLLGSAMSGFKRNNRNKGILRVKTLINEKDREFYEDLMNDKFKKFFNSENAVLPLQDGYSYEELKGNNTGVKDSRDIKNLINDIFEMVASGFSVPLGIAKGDVATVDGITDNFLMQCINPKAKLITAELNRKYYGKDAYLKKSYVKMNTSRIRNVDLEKISKSAEVLFRIGVNAIDDNLKMLGREPLNTNWSKERYVTKNYQSVEAIQQEKSLKGGEK